MYADTPVLLLQLGKRFLWRRPHFKIDIEVYRMRDREIERTFFEAAKDIAI